MNYSNSTKPKRLIVGLSGGVDSAVAAYLLKEAGHDLTGVFMQNWEADRDDPYCTAEQDLSDARAVCDHLDIPFQVVNFSKAYWENVFQHCLNEFRAGRTPNPDILCNQEIKFKAFLNYALKEGAEAIATGHYARNIFQDGRYHLIQGVDNNKDQTYFLYTLNQERLAHAYFPIGNLQKTKVREIAQAAGLLNYAKKDSTGICFIGERRFKPFLQEYLLNEPGPIKTDTGEIIAEHDGLMFYTIGQRKGLEIGGVPGRPEAPWYVLDKDLKHNTLIIGQGDQHKKLFKNKLQCRELHGVSGKAPGSNFSCHAKTRYRQAHQACHVEARDQDHLYVTFDTPQRAVTPGQSIVFYQGNDCLGGGIIQHDATLQP